MPFRPDHEAKPQRLGAILTRSSSASGSGLPWLDFTITDSLNTKQFPF